MFKNSNNANNSSSNKIKNPLLKQLGTTKINQDSFLNKENDKKLCLEHLIDFLSNYNNDKKIVNDKENIVLESDINTESEKISQFYDLPKLKNNLKEIMEGFEFKRYSVIKSIPGKLKFYTNLSFLSSLMICLNEKFIANDENQQVNYLKTLKLYIYNTFTKSFYDMHKYKDLIKDFNFDRINISKNLYNYELTRNEMLVISDIFHINLFIFDISRDRLFYNGVSYIPYKKNIFLLKKEDGFFEPLNLENKFFIDHNNDFIQYLIENNNKIELLFKNDKFREFTINLDNDDYTSYLPKEVKLDIKNKILEKQLYRLNKTDDNLVINDYTENKNIPELGQVTELQSLSDSYDSDDNSDESDSENSICKTIKYNMNDLKKMKLPEISIIAKSLNINLEYKENNKNKKKTKDNLIKEILEK